MASLPSYNRGSYYASESTSTVENANTVLRCIASAGSRAVETIMRISETGRASKNDPALFPLALCTAYGDTATRQAAFQALPRVARTGTHLFHFAAFVDRLRGWGQGIRQALNAWDNDRPAQQVVYQALKYQQRDGWRHRDLLRLVHPKPPSIQHQEIYRWITQGWGGVGDIPHPDEALQQIWVFERENVLRQRRKWPA